MAEKFIRMSDISLSFGGHRILSHIDFSLELGEICSILGENAAGKSSLMNVLSGAYTPDQGGVSVGGTPVSDFSVTGLRERGVYMIRQPCQLIDFFTVEENVFIGQELNCRHSPLLDKKRQLARTEELLRLLNCPLDPTQKVQNLSLSMKLTVELAKALLQGAKVLILDEIMASMSAQESAVILETLRKLAASGIGIIFISHRLEDVLGISDRIVILRDGAVMDELTRNGERWTLHDHAILEKMAGPDFDKRYPKTRAGKQGVLLRLSDACSANGVIRHADLYIRRGEIVGIAGLLGSGKTALARLIAGLDKIKSGDCVLAYHPLHGTKDETVKPAFLSAESAENLIREHSIEHNVTLPALSNFCKGPLLNRKKCQYHTENVLKKYHIQNAASHTKSKYLSSGSQQKLSIAKLLNTNADILVMDEPSNALDVGSKVDLYNIMNNLTHQGYAICFTSSDIDELIGMCDRIYVMFEGRIVAELSGPDTDCVEILSYATGQASGAS